jgi:uncharacterized protein YuzE
MQLKYDLNVGALYIRLSDHAVVRTRDSGDNASVDLDAAGDVVGIEVISAAHPWPLTEILAAYKIPPHEEAQLRATFPAWRDADQRERPPVGMQEVAPRFSVGSRVLIGA